MVSIQRGMRHRPPGFLQDPASEWCVRLWADRGRFGRTALAAESEREDRRTVARSNTATSEEAFADAAARWREAAQERWSAPTGCDKWNMAMLAAHIAGEAVWFANLSNGVVRAEPPLPGHVYEDMKRMEAQELADRTEDAARSIQSSIEEATDDNLASSVDLGWMSMPLWRATSVAAMEAVLHNWDVRVGLDPDATIPDKWARVLMEAVTTAAPQFARGDAIQRHPGVYVLTVGNGVPPTAIHARDGKVTVERSEAADADVTLNVTVDQYVRLFTGRLDVSRVPAETLTAQGDPSRVHGLTAIFPGIANE